MTTRRSSSRFALSVAVALLLAGGAGFAISACSSTTEAGGTAAAEAGADAAPDARMKVDSSTGDDDAAVPETNAQCLARCAKEHPASVTKYNAVDTCWGASCKPSCVDQTGEFDGGAEGGTDGGVNDGGTNLCGTKVSSGVDKACDDCTEQFCCPAWKGCYNDTDCLAYNSCLSDCP